MTPTGTNKLILQSPFAFIFRSGPIPVIFYFPLRPQNFSVDFPSRAAVHQTLDSNFLDFFPGSRAVMARCQMRGTFGYDKRFGGVGLSMSGALHLRAIEALYETFNALSRQVHSQLRTRCEFTMPGRGYYWRTHIESLGIKIANNDPLLYYWELSFVRLTDYLSPGNNIADLISSFSPVGIPGINGIGPAVSSFLGGLF